jgi:hypothetical protein
VGVVDEASSVVKEREGADGVVECAGAVIQCPGADGLSKVQIVRQEKN